MVTRIQLRLYVLAEINMNKNILVIKMIMKEHVYQKIYIILNTCLEIFQAGSFVFKLDKIIKY